MPNKNIKKLSLWLALIAFVCIAGAAFLFYVIDIQAYKEYLYDVNQEKSFGVENVKSINIDSFKAKVNVIETDDNNVKIHIYGKIYSKDNKLKNPVIELNDGKLIVKERNEPKIRIGINLNIGDWFGENKMIIDLFLPKVYKEKLMIESSSGDVIADSINLKDLDIDTFSGDIKINRITTDNAGLETSSGNIAVGDITNNKELKINTFSGNQSFINIKSETVYAETSSGNISLGSVDADKVEGNSFSGDIISKKIKGSVLELSTSSGNLITGEAQSGKINCKTFSGDIKFNGISFTDSNMETSSGEVILSRIKNSDFAVNAESSSGKVICDIEIKDVSKESEHDIKGVVGKGSGTLKINTFSGDIKIIK